MQQQVYQAIEMHQGHFLEKIMVFTSQLMEEVIGKNQKFILMAQIIQFNQLIQKLALLIIQYGSHQLETFQEMAEVEFGNRMTLEITLQKSIKLIQILTLEELKLRLHQEIQFGFFRLQETQILLNFLKPITDLMVQPLQLHCLTQQTLMESLLEVNIGMIKCLILILSIQIKFLLVE